MKKLPLLLLVILMGCGYHFEGEKGESISVPYIPNDVGGQLNAELAYMLSTSGQFDYSQSGGALILKVAVLADNSDRIGFRYDRDPTSGKLRKNIVGTENRRTLSAEVTLIDAYTQEVLLGPQVVTANADYDYVDSNSIRDLVFINSKGQSQTVLDFSLGQLDSIEGAHDDTSPTVYRHLAREIVQGLLTQGW